MKLEFVKTTRDRLDHLINSSSYRKIAIIWLTPIEYHALGEELGLPFETMTTYRNYPVRLDSSA